jgi:hypothetical protein
MELIGMIACAALLLTVGYFVACCGGELIYWLRTRLQDRAPRVEVERAPSTSVTRVRRAS